MDQEAMNEAALSRSDTDDTVPSPATEETDLWWGACAGRTLLPHCLISLVTSAIILVVAWSLGAWHGEWVVHHLSLVSIAALWLCMAAYWAFHILTFTYRLTNRRLFISRGFRFRSPADPGLLLDRIVQVDVQRRAIERLVGVGQIRIHIEGNEKPAASMKGVRAPRRVAARIRKAIDQARGTKA